MAFKSFVNASRESKKGSEKAGPASDDTNIQTERERRASKNNLRQLSRSFSFSEKEQQESGSRRLSTKLKQELLGFGTPAVRKKEEASTTNDSRVESDKASVSTVNSRTEEKKANAQKDQYFQDAVFLSEEYLDLANEKAVVKRFSALSRLCWFGGTEVQDFLAKSSFTRTLSQLLANRKKNTEWTQEVNPHESLPARDAYTKFGNIMGRGTNMFRKYSNAPEEVNVSQNMSIATISLISVVCRDNIPVQETLNNTGMLFELVDLLVHPTISEREKKWCVHTIFQLLLSSPVSQGKVLYCEQAVKIRKQLLGFREDSVWSKWPKNYSKLVLQLLGWFPL